MLAVANEVLPARLVEGLQHQGTVLRLAPLHESPLEGLVMGCLGDKHRLHGPGIQTGVPHAGGQGAGSGIKVLDLLGHVALLVEPLGQLDRILQSAAGMGGDEVGDRYWSFP